MSLTLLQAIMITPESPVSRKLNPGVGDFSEGSTLMNSRLCAYRAVFKAKYDLDPTLSIPSKQATCRRVTLSSLQRGVPIAGVSASQSVFI
jgi:hypothetical protein